MKLVARDAGGIFVGLGVACHAGLEARDILDRRSVHALWCRASGIGDRPDSDTLMAIEATTLHHVLAMVELGTEERTLVAGHAADGLVGDAVTLLAFLREGSGGSIEPRILAGRQPAPCESVEGKWVRGQGGRGILQSALHFVELAANGLQLGPHGRIRRG
jgi:hypothetical protein